MENDKIIGGGVRRGRGGEGRVSEDHSLKECALKGVHAVIRSSKVLSGYTGTGFVLDEKF